jgi:RNA-directed DNA polymerase
MSQSITPIRYEWKTIPWKKIQVKVFKLQKRIYRASLRGDVKLVHRLQRLLVKSWSAKLLAIRKVTQENQGKKTAGVDGVKSLTPKERLEMVKNLEIQPSKFPTRRVWIPKPGTDEQRPLGIPVMLDRAMQALFKLALEPEWEAKFEPNSYGFRPGRSAHDAIEAIHRAVSQKPKYVLDADIAKCFDKINHQRLLEKISTFPRLARVIKSWLKSGVLDQGNLFPTEAGTPQGGVISPLLANIALHGLEMAITAPFSQRKELDGKNHHWKPLVIRYADDFVVFHPDQTVIEECQEIASNWLKELDLELKPSKTTITHSLNCVGEPKTPGFNFLGFHIRSYPMGKTHSGKVNGELLGFKTLIKPTKEKVKLHYENIAAYIDQMKGAPQERIIKDLNPVIIGWSNYYSSASSSETFARLDFMLFQKLFSWGRFRHPKKSGRWITRRYWITDSGQGWRFGSEKLTLAKHSNIKIERHTKVKGEVSPFDGNWIYWSKRRGAYPGTSRTVATAIKRQKGRCAECGLHFHPDDLLEIHHLDGNYRNNRKENLVAIHRHCHDQVHGGNSNLTPQLSTHNKGQFGEKPDERKLSRPVLKPSRKGDLPA